MGLYRHAKLLLLRTVASDADATSDTVLVRPSEGDGLTDHDQKYALLIFVDQHGAGSVSARFFTSFGDGLWVGMRRHSLAADGAHMMRADELEGFGPYIKVRVVAAPPDGSPTKPTFRVVCRLISDGPFKADPAIVPSVIEALDTPDDGP